MESTYNPLISTEELFHCLKQPDVIVLDATFNSRKPTPTNRTIPDAIFMNLEEDFRDQSSNLPNQLPSLETLEKSFQNLGIQQNSKVIVYDQEGIYTAPRPWWLLRNMGHQNVYVLDGGLPAWQKAGHPTQSNYRKPQQQGNFKAKAPLLLKTAQDILNNIHSPAFELIDVRSSDRFYGRVPEKRKGLRGGHIPNSINLPYTEVLHDGKYKSLDHISALLSDIHIEGQPLVFSCGSGITACIVLLAASIVTDEDVYLYDGSWTEWASNLDYPVIK